jgi:hypothetical protein
MCVFLRKKCICVVDPHSTLLRDAVRYGRCCMCAIHSNKKNTTNDTYVYYFLHAFLAFVGVITYLTHPKY